MSNYKLPFREELKYATLGIAGWLIPMTMTTDAGMWHSFVAVGLAIGVGYYIGARNG
jgi:hypothetical protein